jgi:hypothetical protein
MNKRKEGKHMLLKKWPSRLLLAISSTILLLLNTTATVPVAFAATAQTPACGTMAYSIGITPTIIHNNFFFGDLSGFRVIVDQCTLAYLAQNGNINQVKVNMNGNFHLPVITAGSYTLLDDTTIVKQTVKQNAQTLLQTSQTCPSHSVAFEMIEPALMYTGSFVGSAIYQLFLHGPLEPGPKSIICG